MRPVLLRSSSRRRETLAAFGFIAPSVVGFVFFIAGPLIAGIGLSLADWDLFNPPRWAGTSNIQELFCDPLLRRTLVNTGVFAAGAVVLNVGLGLLIAVGLNWIGWRRFSAIVRTMIFLPFIMSTAVVAVLWTNLLNRDTGVVNWMLAGLGIGPVSWLTSSTWAMPSVILLDTWKNTGFYVVIFLAGLQSIPKEYYDAVRVDGGSGWATFRHITLPLLSPTILFSVVICLIGAAQVFDSVYVLTKGGPGDATRSVVMYLYQQGFESFRMGYASAVALVLLLVVMTVTGMQFLAARRWAPR